MTVPGFDNLMTLAASSDFLGQLQKFINYKPLTLFGFINYKPLTLFGFCPSAIGNQSAVTVPGWQLADLGSIIGHAVSAAEMAEAVW